MVARSRCCRTTRTGELPRWSRSSAPRSCIPGGPPSHVEVPAGLLDEGAPEDEARREAMEETGLRLNRLDAVASAWSMPGISTERMDLFLAAYGEADRTGLGGGLANEGEAVAVHELPLGGTCGDEPGAAR